MMNLWLGVFFLSASWLFLAPVFASAYFEGLAFVLLGIACNIHALRNLSIGLPRKYSVLFAPLLLTAFVLPFPYNVGVILAIVGLTACRLHARFPWASPFGFSLIFSGLILLIQATALPIYLKFSLRYREVNFLARPVCHLLKIFGINCSLSQGALFVQSAKEILQFNTTLEKLGCYLWLNVTIGALLITIFFARRQSRRWLAFILIAGLSYLLIRYAGFIALYLNWGDARLFWNPWLATVSFALLILMYLKFVPLETPTSERLSGLTAKNRINRSQLIVMGSAFISIFLLIGSWGFYDPGIVKNGKIIIDEKHSDWEWTTRKYDTEWYGRKSGYNYYCLAYFLDHYYDVERNSEIITSRVLSDYDILVIKTPTSKFTTEEIASIVDFVRKGGGLFLIGDHTNVFGTSAYINPVSKEFGLRFRYNATYDLLTGNLSVYKPPRLLPHPVVQLLPPFLFGTSCTLEAPWAAEDVIVGYQLKAAELDYSQKNFFPQKIDTPSMTFGLFLQCAALRYGKGRVLAFTDSTVFSNFWIFMPGKSELLLGGINWLNRQNYLSDRMNSLFFIAGLLFLGTTAFLAIKRVGLAESLFILLCSSFLAIPISLFFFQTVNRHFYHAPKPQTKFTRVCFDLEHSNFSLPILHLVTDSQRGYETFYVWTQRLGYVPQVSWRFQDALQQGDIVIVINPIRPFSDNDRIQVLEYVKRGGRLIVLDGAFNQNSTANDLLGVFDLKLSFQAPRRSFFHDVSGRKISTTQSAASIAGGEPLLVTIDKEPLLAVVKKGRGIVAAMSDSRLFSDSMFGSTGTVPTREQRQLYDLEFWLFSEVMAASKKVDGEKIRYPPASKSQERTQEE